MAKNVVTLESTCIKGINQSIEGGSLDECADARNLWAPGGRVEQRPGTLGLGFLSTGTQATAFTGGVVIKETPIGTFATTGVLDNLGVGSRFYYGFTSTPPLATEYAVGLILTVSATNSNLVTFFAEYWNGSDWVYLPANSVSGGELVLASGVGFCGGATTTIRFVWPTDLAQTAVNSVTAYFFRFTLVAIDGTSSFDAGVTISTSATYESPINTGAGNYLGTIKNGPFFFTGVRSSDTFNGMFSRRVDVGETSVSFNTFANLVAALEPGEPPSSAVVQLTGEWYFTFSNKVFYIDTVADGIFADNLTPPTPLVESRDFAVGNNAPYDRDFVAQRADFPSANYVAYFGSRLWFADKGKISWGAAYPFHKVLPLLSEEPVGSDDETDITGLAGLGENIYVFKQRSMYAMVLEEINAFGLSVFRPKKRGVGGIGCVSNASIRRINSRYGSELVFLSEKGLVAFNGQSTRKVSLDKNGNDRLVSFFDTLTPGKWNVSVAADWRKHSCYLLSLTLNGANFPNTVLVWDYENDAFWIWDGIEAACWIEDTDGRLYFGDSQGRIFEMGNGNTDHGAVISAYVKTNRMALDEGPEFKHALRVSITGENLNSDVDIEVLPDDTATALVSGAGELSFADYNEKAYDVAVYDTDNYTERRRVVKHLDVRVPGSFFQVVVSHSNKNESFVFSSIRLEVLPLGDKP